LGDFEGGQGRGPGVDGKKGQAMRIGNGDGSRESAEMLPLVRFEESTFLAENSRCIENPSFRRTNIKVFKKIALLDLSVGTDAIRPERIMTLDWPIRPSTISNIIRGRSSPPGGDS
jgi:hypothetical protein